MSKRNLVVEDQPDNRQIVRDMLAPTTKFIEAEKGRRRPRRTYSNSVSNTPDKADGHVSAPQSGPLPNPASYDSNQLIVLPFICAGIPVAGALENTSSSIDTEEFWQGYRVMSGIIFVLLAMEILIFGVLQL